MILSPRELQVMLWLVPYIGGLPLRKNDHSNSSENLPPAPDPRGAVLNNAILEGHHSISDLDLQVSPMQSSSISAELAPQQQHH
jgi:hypothetical protein